jgi:hypothetical protein
MSRHHENTGGIFFNASSNRTLPLLAAMALFVAGLYGCKSLPREGGTLDCRSAEQCKVEVSVASGHIEVDFDTVAAHGHNVVWTVVNKAGQSYAFDHDAGIAFKTKAGQQAFRCNPEANDKRYKCNNNTDAPAGKFEYGVRLVGSPVVPPLDPWVVNR